MVKYDRGRVVKIPAYERYCVKCKVRPKKGHKHVKRVVFEAQLAAHRREKAKAHHHTPATSHAVSSAEAKKAASAAKKAAAAAKKAVQHATAATRRSTRNKK